MKSLLFLFSLILTHSEHSEIKVTALDIRYDPFLKELGDNYWKGWSQFDPINNEQALVS